MKINRIYDSSTQGERTEQGEKQKRKDQVTKEPNKPRPIQSAHPVHYKRSIQELGVGGLNELSHVFE